jgi:hypothetical protein
MHPAFVAHRRGRLQLALALALAWPVSPAAFAGQAGAAQAGATEQHPVEPTPSETDADRAKLEERIKQLLSNPEITKKSQAAPAEQSDLHAIDTHAQVESEGAEARRMQLRTLFEGALTDTENWQDYVETEGYRKLLTSIASLSLDDFAKLPIHDLDYAKAMADPDGQRGEYVRWRGLLGHIKAVKLDTPVFDMTDVYRGVVTDARGDNGVIFDLIEPPPRITLREDVVDLEGVLYRGVAYLNPKDKEIRAPYLIARTLRRVDTTNLPRTTSQDNFVLVLVLVAGTFMVGRLAWYFLVQRKKPRASQLPKPASIRQMFDERRARGATDPKSIPPK